VELLSIQLLQAARSAQSSAAEEGTIFFVGFENVNFEPVSEKVHGFDGYCELTLRVAGGEFFRFPRQVIVLLFMKKGLGVGIFVEIFFFRSEMELSVFKEVQKNRSNNVIASACLHRIMKLIDQIDQAFVLRVNFSDLNGQCVVPNYECHRASRA
jgi:hypothetical protein